MHIIEFEELESTNIYAKNHIDSLKNYDVVFTYKQTSGKGRMTRTWYSTKDSLTFSLIIKDEKLIEQFSSLSLISATCVYTLLEKLKIKAQIKWPNDIIVNDQKICGILLEGVSYSEQIKGIVIGIGINVNNEIFPKNSIINPTSIYLETNKKYPIKTILDLLLNILEENLEKLKNNDKSYLQIINENNYLYQKKAYAIIANEKVLVTIDKILDNDHLLVRLNDQDIEINSDEISFHL
jgi:BirA family biotin operon repressor/biotin-[acetyl-CoA-carboxylase] ligase